MTSWCFPNGKRQQNFFYRNTKLPLKNFSSKWTSKWRMLILHLLPQYNELVKLNNNPTNNQFPNKMPSRKTEHNPFHYKSTTRYKNRKWIIELLSKTTKQSKKLLNTLDCSKGKKLREKRKAFLSPFLFLYLFNSYGTP